MFGKRKRNITGIIKKGKAKNKICQFPISYKISIHPNIYGFMIRFYYFSIDLSDLELI